MSKLVACLALVLAAWFIAPAVQGQELSVPIVVSPSTINLESQGTWVTVHAEIPFSDVDRTASVTLDGIVAVSIFADDCGDLVAKFAIADVRASVDVGTVTLTLCGTTTDGSSFSGTDTVRVIRVKGGK